ncbi:MAG: SDR family NAD(P)-dependent oxidoreductase [Deltaproteobacteria bacterium]|jgi:NAD(P)-dependent dehydrogenase (short-subunit alcohol dehydrogenase family)|nr:SDR family NAD(P)-dependent oxidoreductase [Deltaproteobacteria bacterium]MBT7204871.1 SDR family NAD(P)-dependent oxidoreductase [Deltaproteobacteria bacterium]
MDLNNRTVLVTGAGVRLGQAIAVSLGQQGMNVALHYHQSLEGAKETLGLIGGDFKQHGCFQADLRQVSEIELLILQIEAQLGQIDVLINNAADFFPTPLGEVSESEWDHLISLNLKAPFFLSQLVGTAMLKRGQGKIVNIVDVAAERPWPQFLPYCASKAGLVSLTKGLAKALAPAVQVNAVAPGTMLPPPESSSFSHDLAIERSLLKKMGQPDDIAKAVTYFLENDFVTGTVLPVDGGRMLAS